MEEIELKEEFIPTPLQINFAKLYLDIEIPKGKSREELKDMAVRIHEDLKKAGIGFGELTEEHRKEMREIAKELGCKEVKEK